MNKIHWLSYVKLFTHDKYISGSVSSILYKRNRVFQERREKPDEWTKDSNTQTKWTRIKVHLKCI